MTFCQVVLSSKIVEDIRVSNYELVQKLIEENPNDPIPIPIDDPPPQVSYASKFLSILYPFEFLNCQALVFLIAK